jgi:2,4-dienoyl-CoA reductase-like NADH-dependent reductase (Old Yellow Enzyme family)
MESKDGARLMAPFQMRSVAMRNRIVVSPMCQYSAVNGLANDWHLVHIGSRAVGGAGMVMMEAAAVEARGRISAYDLGLWDDAQIEPLERITRFAKAQGSAICIQLAHAGRKAGTARPWETPGEAAEAGGWECVAPGAIPFHAGDPAPHALTKAEIAELVRRFAEAAERCRRAGFDAVEIHGAHGYLIHQFLSPLSNRRDDEYGGSPGNRMRFALEVTEAVRAVWPAELPLLFRVSATDWVDGGWSPDETVELARELKARGVDLIDVSSGGAVPGARIPVGPAYQVPFAERIRREAGVATGAVGLITEARQADAIVRSGQADLVFLARGYLRDPYFAIHAAIELGEKPAVPPPYSRAF